jgi:peptide/nickel transport system ATP-binding protein
VIEVRELQKFFPVKETFLRALTSTFARGRKFVKAVNGLSFTMRAGEIMGLAGESGCGKTTTGMLLLRLYPPSGGKIIFDGEDISSLRGRELTYFRSKAQMIFQDPYESLNPRFTVFRSIEEPLIVNKVHSKVERKKRVIRAMERSKLVPLEAFFDKYPHELSGGERQRVGIARAIVLEPILLVADEAVSMLDVSIRASILNLLRTLTEEIQMATLYISHDISLLGSICDKLAIMYAGEIVEMGKPENIVNNPLHPYTKALIAAVPVPEFSRRKSKLSPIAGEPPDLINLPRGCNFRPRCALAGDKCISQKPQLHEINEGHFAACDLVGELLCRENT